MARRNRPDAAELVPKPSAGSLSLVGGFGSLPNPWTGQVYGYQNPITTESYITPSLDSPEVGDIQIYPVSVNLRGEFSNRSLARYELPALETSWEILYSDLVNSVQGKYPTARILYLSNVDYLRDWMEDFVRLMGQVYALVGVLYTKPVKPDHTALIRHTVQWENDRGLHAALQLLWSDLHSKVVPQGVVDFVSTYFTPLLTNPLGSIFVPWPTRYESYKKRGYADKVVDLHFWENYNDDTAVQGWIDFAMQRYIWLFGGDQSDSGSDVPNYVVDSGKIVNLMLRHFETLPTFRSPLPRYDMPVLDLYAQMPVRAEPSGNFVLPKVNTGSAGSRYELNELVLRVADSVNWSTAYNSPPFTLVAPFVWPRSYAHTPNKVASGNTSAYTVGTAFNQPDPSMHLDSLRLWVREGGEVHRWAGSLLRPGWCGFDVWMQAYRNRGVFNNTWNTTAGKSALAATSGATAPPAGIYAGMMAHGYLGAINPAIDLDSDVVHKLDDISTCVVVVTSRFNNFAMGRHVLAWRGDGYNYLAKTTAGIPSRSQLQDSFMYAKAMSAPDNPYVREAGTTSYNMPVTKSDLFVGFGDSGEWIGFEIPIRSIEMATMLEIRSWFGLPL